MITTNDIGDLGTKLSIGASGTAYSFFGMPYSDVAAICTAIFMIISIVLTIPKLIALVKTKGKE